jgi:8-oxo-dGTP pyrophosphatase MutT (NUDIX family)
MAISPHIRRLRALVGPELLLLPSVTVLCCDDSGRVLLVRQTDSDQWATIGGAIEPDEAPRAAAVREAREEAGVDVELLAILDVVGGASFRVRYPSGDETAYVSTVFDARVLSGQPTADGDETSDVRWFTLAELVDLDLNPFARATFTTLGWLP